MDRKYICIDLKSFYASVECVERGLDALDVNLVVADKERSEKTICLAVSPALKEYKIPGRIRLFELIERVKDINAKRRTDNEGKKFSGKSYSKNELKENKSLELDYIVAPPRMALYIKYSVKIYGIYLKYIAPQDIHVYSIDEVFIDVSKYLDSYNMTARELAYTIVNDILCETGITATVGIGTNMYLAKVAMDIEAKKMQPDSIGARIAELDEMSYRKKLWNHKPLTDFWRVGKGYYNKLYQNGICTMGDIARCSVGKENERKNEDLLYKLFGVNAELLIDHAWGYEPCRMEDIKAYKAKENSLGAGQVLKQGYDFDGAKLVATEMADSIAFDLLDKELLTDCITIMVCYDSENLKNSGFKGDTEENYYGKKAPKKSHGTIELKKYTSSAKIICDAVKELFDKVADKNLYIRRIYITASHVIPEEGYDEKYKYEQINFLTEYENEIKDKEAEARELDKEKQLRMAMLKIKKQYGKNAVLKGMSLKEGATGIERNNQIGGHKA